MGPTQSSLFLCSISFFPLTHFPSEPQTISHIVWTPACKPTILCDAEEDAVNWLNSVATFIQHSRNNTQFPSYSSFLHYPTFSTSCPHRNPFIISFHTPLSNLAPTPFHGKAALLALKRFRSPNVCLCVKPPKSAILLNVWHTLEESTMYDLLHAVYECTGKDSVALRPWVCGPMHM